MGGHCQAVFCLLVLAAVGSAAATAWIELISVPQYGTLWAYLLAEQPEHHALIPRGMAPVLPPCCSALWLTPCGLADLNRQKAAWTACLLANQWWHQLALTWRLPPEIPMRRSSQGQ